MYEKVLVAIDHSDASDHALAAASACSETSEWSIATSTFSYIADLLS